MKQDAKRSPFLQVARLPPLAPPSSVSTIPTLGVQGTRVTPTFWENSEVSPLTLVVAVTVCPAIDTGLTQEKLDGLWRG